MSEIDATLPGMHSDKLPDIDIEKIASQQILEADHSVFSIQWVIIPETPPPILSSDDLLQRYLHHIKRCTMGIIRPERSADGIEFRLAGSSMALFQFLPPRKIQESAGEKIVLRISGGLLVQPQECDRGQLEIITEKTAAGNRLTLKLSDYCPLLLGSREPSIWRKWLYRFTQAYIHRVVTVGFLARIYRSITSKPVRRGVVNIVVRKGRAT